MKKLCPKCGKVLYNLNRLDSEGNTGADPEFKKIFSQEKEMLFIACPHCKSKFPAMLNGANRINIIEESRK